MPDFANLRKTLLCQGEPRRVPMLEYHVDAGIKTQWLGRPPATIDDEAAFALQAGYDFVPRTFSLRRTLLERTTAGGTAEDGHLMRAAQWPYDDRRQQTSTRFWAAEQTGVITDSRRFDAFAWPDAEEFPYEEVARLGQILPPQAKVIPLVGYVFAASWMLMGFERFCFDLADGGRLAARVIDRVGQIHYQIVVKLLQFDCVGAICMPDDLAYRSGLMVRPEFLRKHVFPWHERIGRLVRQKNLPYLFHSDGCYLAVLKDLLACGYHAIHPCEPASMDIEALKRQYGGRLCLCGNIDLDTTLTRGTPQQVEQEVRHRIRTLGPGGGYCCGSSNSVTDYVPYENFLAMREAIQKYGKYPL